jgi:transcriptional regulator with XRE-family HTH domain
MATFGETLKRLREEAGLTQPTLAEKAGMNRFGIAKIEQGVREPAWSTVVALCKALNVSCQTFMEQVETPAKEEKPIPKAKPKKADRGK